MILIRNIDYYEVDGDTATIYSYQPWESVRVRTNNGAEVVDAEVLQELVKGRRFRRPHDGTDIVVGVSRQVQDVLGLQYEAWGNLEKAYEAEARINARLMNECNGWQNKFAELENASIWRRILWVFKGLF